MTRKGIHILPERPAPAITAKPPMNGFAVYIMSLAVMIGAYSLYLKYAVPVIEGPPQIVKRTSITPLADLPSPREQKSHLIPLLPANAWELGECKTLFTSSGTILFQEIEQLEDGKLKVTPFTMLSGVSIDNFSDPNFGNETPTVLRTTESAILKFTKPLPKVMQGDGEMEGARLIGAVDIYRPDTEPGVNDRVHVLTSNVQIDRQRVSTLETVTFAIGPHRGRGRNLIIDLEQGSDDLKSDFSNIKGVQKFELAFLEVLRIEPSKDSNSLPVSNKPGKKKLFSDNKSPIQVSCEGPFQFDLAENLATFEKNVLAQQVDAYRDNIQCEKLTLKFDSQQKESKKLTDKSEFKDLKLSQFIAEGTPAKVVSNSRAAIIRGSRLSYDAAEDRIHGTSENQPMTLITPEYQIVTRELNYTIPESDGEIGPIFANGPGHLLKVSDKDDKEFFVRWTKSLRTETNPDNTDLLRIIVSGDAYSKLGSDTIVKADQLDLIVREIPKIVMDQDTGQPKQSSEFLAVKLVASGNVKMTSPKLNGTTESLTALWEDENKLSGSPRSDHTVAYRGTLTLGDQESFVERSGFQEVIDDRQVLPRVVRASAVAPAKPKRKMNFNGEKVTVQLSGQSKDAEIRNLLIDGHVDVSTGDDAKSMKITGESLRMIPQAGEENFRVQVASSDKKPAKIVTKDFQLTGDVINLDHAANKVWVEGVGEMLIEPSKVQSSSSASNSSSKKMVLKKLTAKWEGGMVFDGDKIYFEREIDLDVTQVAKDGTQELTRATSEGLSVTLKQPVNLKEMSDQSSNQSPRDAESVFEFQELVFTNTVSESQQVFTQVAHAKPPKSSVPNPNSVVETMTLNASGNPVEKRVISVPYLKVDADSGALGANGPGSITTYQMSDGSKKKSNPFGKLAGNRKRVGQSENSPKLSLVRVNFDSTLTANSVQKEMIVRGNLRTLYSPISNWDVMLNPDNHQSPPESVMLTCEQLHLAQWARRSNSEKTSEMIATGNTRIQSSEFQATADRVSYSELSDILTIEGTPRSDANLWYKQTPNDRNPTHLIAEKITYRLEDQATETHGIKKLNINRK